MVEAGQTYSMPSGRRLTVVEVREEKDRVAYTVDGVKMDRPMQKPTDEFLLMVRKPN